MEASCHRGCRYVTAILLTLSVWQPTAASPAPVNTDPAIATRVEALKQKTLKDLVQVKGGTFLMGDFGPRDTVKLPYSGERNDDVLRDVTLDDYAITAHKITYADFDVYTDATGKKKVAQTKTDLEYRNLPNIPAGVDWKSAQSYCHWIGEKINTPMDLPTEAQWEYAARSRGKMIVWATDNGKVEDGRNVESFDQASEARQKGGYGGYGPTAIGRYPPNQIGLYDMIDHGFEWARDWYSDSYDPKDLVNPAGPKTGTEKVQRSHSNSGGDSLALVSMTFTRFKQVPSPPPNKMPDTGEVIEVNQNAFNAFRCVAIPTR
ncbi:formylglycine-generating enzyme family protein [Xanthomonas maliensis]|uniref:formylglycine-generating enzyme family protein n=1 Tax=Xanthomonas maliensis TaxID=1321368 RepID=UPI001264044C|nr:SUMF1/EgtB/PvdO family nonheme iron enzyme [Xanthomonas maliensis]KAB7764743.1 sulfatase modifying factor 1 [Xanthomonas maliensis]